MNIMISDEILNYITSLSISEDDRQDIILSCLQQDTYCSKEDINKFLKILSKARDHTFYISLDKIVPKTDGFTYGDMISSYSDASSSWPTFNYHKCCPYCHSMRIFKNGKSYSPHTITQRYICLDCKKTSGATDVLPNKHLPLRIQSFIISCRLKKMTYSQIRHFVLSRTQHVVSDSYISFVLHNSNILKLLPEQVRSQIISQYSICKHRRPVHYLSNDKLHVRYLYIMGYSQYAIKKIISEKYKCIVSKSVIHNWVKDLIPKKVNKDRNVLV